MKRIPCKENGWGKGLWKESERGAETTTVESDENPMDGGAWRAAVHGVTKSETRLRDFTFTFHFHALEREMATHSSVLAWRIPGTGKPGGLPSMGSHRVGHDWSDLAAAAAADDDEGDKVTGDTGASSWCRISLHLVLKPPGKLVIWFNLYW